MCNEYDWEDCPVCGGPPEILDGPGNMMHYRCVDCGTEFHFNILEVLHEDDTIPIQRSVDPVASVPVDTGPLAVPMGEIMGLVSAEKDDPALACP